MALEMDESDTNNNAIGFTVLASFLSLSLYVCVRMYVWRRLVATDWVALVGLLTPLDPWWHLMGEGEFHRMKRGNDEWWLVVALVYDYSS